MPHMSPRSPFPLLLSLLLSLSASRAAAGEAELVSGTGLAAAVAEAGGIRLVPALNIVPASYTEDASPPQVLEVLRPSMGPLTVGRLLTSCSCLRASMAKKTFAAGERALIEVRNVKRPPASGAAYAVFVQLVDPVRETLQFDLVLEPLSAAPAPGPRPDPGGPTASDLTPFPSAPPRPSPGLAPGPNPPLPTPPLRETPRTIPAPLPPAGPRYLPPGPPPFPGPGLGMAPPPGNGPARPAVAERL